MEENMIYKKPEIKSLKSMNLSEYIGPVQTGYAQVMWVQTQPITYNQQVHTNQFADATIVKLEKKA
jgi:hypothetical protein